MTDEALLVTRKWGPLSSVLPVQTTSISRAAAFPSHGFSNVPGPAEPFGQSLRGGSAAETAGGRPADGADGADASDAAETEAAADPTCASARSAGPSFEQATSIKAMTNDPSAPLSSFDI